MKTVPCEYELCGEPSVTGICAECLCAIDRSDSVRRADNRAVIKGYGVVDWLRIPAKEEPNGQTR